MKKTAALSGLAISLFGIFLLVNASSRITGFAVLDGFGNGVSFTFGLVLFITGLFTYFRQAAKE